MALRQGGPHRPLGIAVVVGQGRVEVVDAVAYCLIPHLRHGLPVDGLVGQERETHRPETQG